MNELGQILLRLGIGQYVDAFIAEGFDNWETVLDITESDLDALNVKLGHRRKLQREIAKYRGILYHRYLGSPFHEAASDSNKAGEIEPISNSGHFDRRGHTGGDAKRKYRRHAKPDENAPNRPPSAYVIFSNKIREDVKRQNLSFTDIAKLVGENWQLLSPSEKEPYETQGAVAKEKYNVELAEYKRTDNYEKYMQYLAEFKAKHSTAPTDGKRPKLEIDLSTSSGSGGASSTRQMETFDPAATAHVLGHGRRGSLGSSGSISHPSALSSPTSIVPGISTQVRSATPGTNLQSLSSPGTDSHPSQWGPIGTQFGLPFPSQSHSSFEGSQEMRGEQELRSAQLSVVTLAEHKQPNVVMSNMSVGLVDVGGQPRRSVRLPQTLSHQDTSNSSLSSNLSSGSGSTVGTILPKTPADELWNQRNQYMRKSFVDVSRPVLPPLAPPVPYPDIPQLKSSDRIRDISSPTYPDAENGARILPPPGVVSPTQNDSPHVRNRFRGAFTGQRERTSSHSSEDHDGSRSPAGDIAEPIGDPSDPLAVLAYAGRVVDSARNE